MSEITELRDSIVQLNNDIEGRFTAFETNIETAIDQKIEAKFHSFTKWSLGLLFAMALQVAFNFSTALSASNSAGSVADDVDGLKTSIQTQFDGVYGSLNANQNSLAQYFEVANGNIATISLNSQDLTRRIIELELMASNIHDALEFHKQASAASFARISEKLDKFP